MHEHSRDNRVTPRIILKLLISCQQLVHLHLSKQLHLIVRALHRRDSLHFGRIGRGVGAKLP